MQRSNFSSQRTARMHRRRAHHLALLAGILAVAAASVAQAQEVSDIRRGAPPVVIVLLDTSGSMEFLDKEGVYPGCVYNEMTTKYKIQSCRDVSDCSPGMRCEGGYCLPPTYLKNIFPQPTTAFTRNHVFQKTRAVQAKEVLSGRYDNYWCEEVPRTGDPFTLDDTYLIPHFEARSSGQITESGLIFLNRDFVRFGFFPFDTDKVGIDEWSWPQDNRAPENDVWNLGIRDANAPWAPAVWVGDMSDPEQGKRQASLVERSVAEFIPYGGTPLAAMFSDVNRYLDADPDIVNDPFKDCRPKEIILISDGYPTFDDCALCKANPSTCDDSCDGAAPYPYDTTLQELSKLVADHDDVRVHVVGFNIDSEEQRLCPSLNPPAAGGPFEPTTCVDQMAFVGGSDASGTANGKFAYIADDQLTLTRNLTRVLNSIVNGTSARTATRATTRTRSRQSSPQQYQFSAAFSLDDRAHLWKGVLERVTLDCRGAVLDVTDFSDELNAIPDLEVPSTRRLLTTLRRDGSGAADLNSTYYTEASSALIKLNGPDLATRIPGLTQAELNRWFRAGVLEERIGNTVSPVDFDNIVEILEGLDPVRNTEDLTNPALTKRRLGGIYHASPVIVGGPELNLDIPGYERFSNAVNPVDNPRRTAVAVGSKDGMLHYFNAEYEKTDNTSPLELWAFLPEELHDKAYLQKATHIYGVDAAPVVRDIRMYRSATPAPAGYVDPVQDSQPIAFNDIWSTVLVGGLRAGGQAYYALDVTYPENPRFLWELNPELETRRIANLSAARDRLAVPADIAITRPLIGLTYGEPGVGTVVLREGALNSPLSERGIAVLGGGLPVDPNDAEQGRVMYVVEMATGRIIRRFLNAKYRDGATSRIKAPITGSVALYSDFPGAFATRAFVGDAEGRLYRLDMRNPDPAQWSFEEFHNAFDGLTADKRRPIYLKPSTATGPNGEVLVLYGTGDVDNLELRDQVNRVFSLSEDIQFAPATGLVTAVVAKVNWQLELQGGEKLTGSPIVFDRTAYFSTFRPDQGDVCSFGNARIYAVDYYGDDPDSVTDIISQFTTDEVGSAANQDAAITYNDTSPFIELGANSVIFGLEIAGSPSCTGDTPDALNNNPSANVDPIGSNNVNSDLSLIAQTGTTAGQNGGGVPGSKLNKLNFKLQRPPTAAFETAWAKVLN